MKTGESLSIWLSTEDRRRLEEACAIAGYSHLSRYVRERALDRIDASRSLRSGQGFDEWQHAQPGNTGLTELAQSQKSIELMLAMLLGLARRKTTTVEFDEVMAAAASRAGNDVLSAVAPELVGLLRKLEEGREWR
jgi:hypothetical protein